MELYNISNNKSTFEEKEQKWWYYTPWLQTMLWATVIKTVYWHTKIDQWNRLVSP